MISGGASEGCRTERRENEKREIGAWLSSAFRYGRQAMGSDPGSTGKERALSLARKQ